MLCLVSNIPCCPLFLGSCWRPAFLHIWALPKSRTSSGDHYVFNKVVFVSSTLPCRAPGIRTHSIYPTLSPNLPCRVPTLPRHTPLCPTQSPRWLASSSLGAATERHHPVAEPLRTHDLLLWVGQPLSPHMVTLQF